MTAVVTPGNLAAAHFDIGTAIANAITVKPDGVVASRGAAAPVAAPGPSDPILFVQTTTMPASLFLWDGTSWVQVSGPVADVALSAFQSYDPVANVLTLALSDGTTVDVPLTDLISDTVNEINEPLTDAFGVGLGFIRT